MGSENGRLKRLVAMGLKPAIWLTVLLALIVSGIAIYHYYQERHVTVIYLDDISTSHPNDKSVSDILTDAAFDEFTAAFAEDSACRSFTLVRETATHGRSWSFPHAYWFVLLNPVPDELDMDRDYSRIGWDMHLAIGEEYSHSSISQSSTTAKEAAHRICVIASQDAGKVW
jgi:hypothetical protein